MMVASEEPSAYPSLAQSRSARLRPQRLHVAMLPSTFLARFSVRHSLTPLSAIVHVAIFWLEMLHAEPPANLSLAQPDSPIQLNRAQLPLLRQLRAAQPLQCRHERFSIRRSILQLHSTCLQPMDQRAGMQTAEPSADPSLAQSRSARLRPQRLHVAMLPSTSLARLPVQRSVSLLRVTCCLSIQRLVNRSNPCSLLQRRVNFWKSTCLVLV